MRTARWIVSVSIVCVLVAALSHAHDAPAPAPPAGAQPTPPPATAPAAPTHTVKKGRLALKIDAPGTFLPASPVEVRVRPEGFKGELTILSAAANGASVKEGEPLIQVDPADLNRELEAA